MHTVVLVGVGGCLCVYYLCDVYMVCLCISVCIGREGSRMNEACQDE